MALTPRRGLYTPAAGDDMRAVGAPGPDDMWDGVDSHIVPFSSALASPPSSPVVGQEWLQTDTNRLVIWTGAEWHVMTNKPRVSVRISADSSAIASGVAHILSWSTETYDTDNMWVIGSPTRVTIQTAGYYMIHVQAATNAIGSNGLARAQIRLNGTGQDIRSCSASLNSAISQCFSGTWVMKFATSDYYEVICTHNNSTSLAWKANPFTNLFTHTSATYLRGP